MTVYTHPNLENQVKRAAFAVILAVALPLTASAQQETLLSDLDERGGYGGPSLKIVQTNSEFGLLVGGQGAMVVGKKLAIGGGGWSLSTDHTISNSQDEEFKIDFSYGGILFEYLVKPDKMIHYQFDLIAGAGSIKFDDTGAVGGAESGSDKVYVFEPGAYVVLNVSKKY